MKFFYFFLVFISFFLVKLFYVGSITAEDKISCENRYVTLVNPVRGRDLWIDKTVNPLINQYSLIKQYGFAATWLLQYDVLRDEDVIREIKKFNGNQELGVFLEISQKIADEAKVIYPLNTPWFSPQAVFLSSYSQSDRLRLIDKLFSDFKLKFGYYPKSAGAWWIDSYSLNYMRKKYHIKSAMIVADQKTTDNYGVWGQWWGVPYYPSKANILTPASNLNNKLDVVVTQWAQRDPLLAFGEGSKYSNYSLQANDYTDRGKATEYFSQLVDIYLNCQNPIGQITVGLETGIESVKSLDEYKNQLASLKEKNKLQFVTMDAFADRFNITFPDFPQQFAVSYQDSVWNLTTVERFNKKLGEKIIYNQDISFADYFLADNSKFLDRRLPDKVLQKNISWFPWFLVAGLGLLIFSMRKNLMKVWCTSMLFTIGAFGLILRSSYIWGWKVYFGPELPYLKIFQTLLVLATFLVFWFMSKRNYIRKNLCLLPMLFGLNFLIQAIRVSYFADRYYFGFSKDALRFIGISIKSISDIKLINQDFPSYISGAFLKVDFRHLWENPILATTLYPLIYIVGGTVFGLFLTRLPKKIQMLIKGILVILFLLYLNSIFQADPRLVLPILLQ